MQRSSSGPAVDHSGKDLTLEELTARNTPKYIGYTVNGRLYNVPQGEALGKVKAAIKGLSSDQKEAWMIANGYQVVKRLRVGQDDFYKQDLIGGSRNEVGPELVVRCADTAITGMRGKSLSKFSIASISIHYSLMSLCQCKDQCACTLAS